MRFRLPISMVVALVILPGCAGARQAGPDLGEL